MKRVIQVDERPSLLQSIPLSLQHLFTIPTPVMGGVSLLLFGVIAASGIRMMVESKIDYSKPVNLILTTVVLVIGISGAAFTSGKFVLKGMALATVVAILLSLFFAVLDKLKLLNE